MMLHGAEEYEEHLVTDIQLHEYNRERPVRPVSDDGWCQVRRVDIYSIDHAGREYTIDI